MKQMFGISWQEQAVPWQGDHPLVDIIQAVEDNPFDPFTEIDLPPNYDFYPYSREQAIAWMRQGTTPSIGLRHTAVFWSTIARRDFQNNVNFGIDDARAQRVSEDTIIAYIHRIARLMPHFMFAHAAAIPSYAAAPPPNLPTLPALPWCFGLSLKWLHLLPPYQYQLDFTREDLLNAPAFSVKEAADGWIELRSFEHPLAFATEENQQQISTLTQYLRARMQSLQSR